MVDDLNKITKHEDFDVNCKIQLAEIRVREKEIWDNNRFCSCGADNFWDCDCEAEKKKRFKQRRKRKINNEFSEELDRLMKGQLPKTGHQSRKEGE